MNHRLRAIHVRAELPAAPKRVDDEPPAVPGEDELTEVDVPVALPRPADVLACTNGLAGLDERVDMAVTEMPDAGEPADAAGCRLVYAAPLDRVDAMRPPGRRAPLRPVVAHRHVDALVVDRAAPAVGPRIEERAADRMLPLERQHRPAAPRVVVALERLKPAWNPLRHHLGDITNGRGRTACSGMGGAGLEPATSWV